MCDDGGEWVVKFNGLSRACVDGLAPLGSRSSADCSRPRQNGRYFADDIFKCIFLNEIVFISIIISLKFIPNGPISNSSIGSDNGMAPNRRQTIIWTKDDYFTDAYMRHSASMS